MNSVRLFLSTLFLLLSSCFSSPLEAILYGVTIINLPNNNRLIALYDHHTYQGVNDEQQFYKALQALRDRADSSNRPLYILMESCVNNLYEEGPTVMTRLQDRFEVKLELGQKFDHISIEDIETDIRMFAHAIGSIFRAKELSHLNDENSIRSLREVSFKIGSITFKDLLIDFKKQYERVLKEREKLYLLCDTDEEKEKIKDYTDTLLEDTTFTFRLMQKYLLDKEVCILSDETMYHKTYNWEKEFRETIRSKCRSYYVRFFDFNALARIFTLHKQQGSIDIMLIAGGHHCSEVVQEIEWLLQTKLAYMLFDTSKVGVKGLPLNILYKTFQDKTPQGIEALCPSCVLL